MDEEPAAERPACPRPGAGCEVERAKGERGENSATGRFGDVPSPRRAGEPATEEQHQEGEHQGLARSERQGEPWTKHRERCAGLLAHDLAAITALETRRRGWDTAVDGSRST